MKFDWRLLTVLILALGLMWGCESTEDDPDLTEFEILSKYMIDQAMDSPDVISGWITTAGDIVGNEANYYIIDIRSAELFAAAHVPGAVNSPGKDILTAAEGNTADLPILVVCYSGQSAGHAVMALRLSGYTDAKVLKFGMSSWGPTWSASWDNNIGDAADGHENWSFDAAPALPDAYADPVLNTGEETGDAILAARVDAMLDGWFKGIANSAVLDAPTNYDIINYWGATDYDHYGHIAGAYQVAPNTLTLLDDAVNIINPDAETVVYCWTGQTSSMMTAWLNVLGFDAYSLKFGANGMIHTTLDGHKWTGVDTDKTTEP